MRARHEDNNRPQVGQQDSATPQGSFDRETGIARNPSPEMQII